MKNILFEVKNYVGFVTLNREKAMNAFNYDTLCELASVVESIRTNSEVRAVVFLGAGEKAFSVGADLKERKTLSEQEVRRNVYKIGEVFKSIANLPQPTIAAMNGYAFGGGMELALSCDFRIAVSDAVMGLTETSLAIIPGAGGTQRLPRLIGEAKAMELILTAKRMTADEAYQYGVVTKVVERARFLEEVNEFVGKIQANGPIAIQQAKFAIKNGMNVDLHTGLEIERKAYEITIPTEDRIEALQAFSEKRKPNFKGK
ncbi:enoyl-CoA hydratase-related protein [Heyndrickxia sporothermodurans]|uniref:Enoyl-CoA hydratase n=1 Tax=Heyndrickxia sporothermodurans TaxID=46224 RepID=A0A150KMW6_9BACI|nr:enoyl-CoA hydratase-related protein [Heyndrickxia sporothermodurans]KYC97180.1 Enoyl-CoA hydratase [Heyndrickxia sporothermodurans]MBL5768873.1 enoyl-CoA hydratase/isomerase family protein [Heyndrickxia sporothermodurans]MBL5772636.1 enoyl-CoA hydratase/isomerase family protein [Heyndrickxia sporothermodurans]MBL5776146.1 enoyl-CoA hydratase/isomerase family protein [Heyndrickxia sporothermodurans]MBL5779661.1 enoyl-CoA hydratase/isomerase family protein [Heyndrickxia sporothermodurans]